MAGSHPAWASVAFAPRGRWAHRGGHWGAVSPGGKRLPFVLGIPLPCTPLLGVSCHPLPGLGVQGGRKRGNSGVDSAVGAGCCSTPQAAPEAAGGALRDSGRRPQRPPPPPAACEAA